MSTVSARTPELIEQLVSVWERSVRATHAFLSEEEVAEIKPFVPQALMGVETLVVAAKDGEAVGFMGVDAFFGPDSTPEQCLETITKLIEAKHK